MDSPKSRLQDATLISAPGTPYAFSTAIKPSGSFSHEPTNGQSSLHEIKESLSPDLSILNSSLTGRLSLDSVYSSKDGKTASHDRSDNVDLEALNNEQRSGLRSPNDTVTSESLGILDLDAMQDSSMTSFPTSPVTTEGLHLYLSETTSVPPSTQISLAPPPSTQISLAPLIKPLSHREEATQPLTRESGVPVCVPSNDPGYGRDLYDITVGDESQDIESDLSLSEGELEQLNATLTGDETDKSMSRENSSYISTPEKNKQVDAVTTINKVAVDNNATIPSTCTTPLTDCSATSSTSSVQTSLPSSLTDLAKSLGTSEDNTTPRHEGKVHSFGAGCIDGDDGVYNPFDSEDYIGSGLGDFEFDEQNPVSFLEQLDKDEQEIRRTELTPPISQLKSFSSSNPGSFIKEADVNVSITSYFREKSDKIGQLSAKLPPDERPHFNDSVSHVIQSPPSLMNTPTTCHMTPSTLTKPTVSPPIINPSVPTFDGLTPVVTSNTSPSAQVQIPKLNLTDVSRLSSEHRQLVSEASRSSDQGLPSIYFKSSPSPHISTEGASLNASLSPSSEQGLPSVYFKSSPSPHTSAEGTILNASLSPSSEQGLPSMYFKTDSSTLIFPDLSTVSSLPSGCEPPDNMATPPSAYLPVGFNFTEVSTFLEPTSLSLSMDMSLPGGGDGSHSVVVDSTQNTVCSSNTEILNTSSNTQSVHTPDVQPTIHSPVVALKAHSTTPSADLSLSTPTLPASQNAPLTNSQATPTTTNSLFVNNRPNLSTGPSLKEHSSTRPKDFHGSVDPKLIASGEKLAQLQSVLDASQFDVEAFLNTLKGTSPPNIALEVSTAHSLVTTSSVTTAAHSTPQDLGRYSVTTAAHSTPQDLSRYSVTTAAHSTPQDLSRYSVTTAAHSTPQDLSRYSVTTTAHSTPQDLGRYSVTTAAHSTPQDLSRYSVTTAAHSTPQDLSRYSVTTAAHSTPQDLSRYSVTTAAHSTPQDLSRYSVTTAAHSTPQDLSRYSVTTAAHSTPQDLSRYSVTTAAHSAPQDLGRYSVTTTAHSTPQDLSRYSVTTAAHSTPQDLSRYSVTTTAHSTPQDLSRYSVTTAAHSTPQDLGRYSVTTAAHSTPQDLSRYSVTTTAHSTPQDLSRYSVITTAHSTPSDLPVSLISASQARSNHTMLTHTPILDPASTQSPLPRLQSLAPPPAHSLVYTSPRSTISHVTQSGSRCAESAISPKSSPPMVIPSSWLQVASSLCFSRVCCVCDSVREPLAIHNSGDRWLQVTFELSQIYRDGLEVSHDPDKVFGVPHKVFIGPGHKEQIKVTFSPSLEGSYDAALSLFACLVVSNNRPSTPLATVIIKALAESPKLEIMTPSTQGGTETGPVLEFGALVGGTSVSLPVGLSNHGRCTLPLRVTVNCTDQLNRLYFSLNDSSNEAHPSPRSHPQSCSLLLLPQSHSQSYTVQLQLSAPKSHGHDAGSPPLELRGSLDVTVDSPNGSLPVTSIPIHATVGTARLLAPGLFKSNDFSLSCVTGQTKSESVPLKNAGNISLTVRVKISSAHSSLFNVSPSSIQLLPGEESQLDVTFGPTSEPLTSEATLMIHVEPSGPDYNLKLKGVALHVPPSHVDTPPVLSVRTLTLPETEVGGCSEGVLDIHNPYPSTLQWTLTPVASPFLRKVSSIGSGDMFKVNYLVFQAHTERQSLLPHATDKVKVLFQPQEDGMFSQIWGIQVCSSQAEDQTIRLSFGGKAHPISSPKRREPLATIPPRSTAVSSPKRRELPATIPPRPTGVASHHYHEEYAKNERIPREKQRSHDTRVTFKEDPVGQDQHDPKKIKQISKWLSQVSHTPSFHPPTPSHHPPTHHTSSHHPPTHHASSHHPPAHHTPSHRPPTHHTSSHHPPTHHTPSHSTYTTPRHPPLPRVSPSNRSAYMREDEITFPPTKPGTRSTVKVQVCNRDVPLCKFTVIQLGQPFSVDHRSFDLGARQCARLPVHFTPEAPGRFEGILAIKTNHKHQMFAVLKGESPKL